MYYWSYIRIAATSTLSNNLVSHFIPHWTDCIIAHAAEMLIFLWQLSFGTSWCAPINKNKWKQKPGFASEGSPAQELLPVGSMEDLSICTTYFNTIVAIFAPPSAQLPPYHIPGQTLHTQDLCQNKAYITREICICNKLYIKTTGSWWLNRYPTHPGWVLCSVNPAALLWRGLQGTLLSCSTPFSEELKTISKSKQNFVV